MSDRTKKLLEQALALPPDELADFMNALTAAVEDSGDIEFDPAYEAEIARRVDEMESGRVKGIPWETVWRELTGRQRAANANSDSRGRQKRNNGSSRVVSGAKRRKR